jgi:HEPN domain-containing protein
VEKQDYINYWVKTSKDDLSSMESVFNAGKYDWALFIRHLALEKVLKAFWVKNNTKNIPPKIHNLIKIADEAQYPKSEEEALLFLEINDFNPEARYPDFKADFNKKCTKEFAEGYLKKIKELFQCIARLI